MRNVILLLLGLCLAFPAYSPAADPAAPGEQTGVAISVFNPSGVREDGFFVDTLLNNTGEDNPNRPPLSGDFPETDVEQIMVASPLTADEEISELFRKRGWTDGLPVVPPTWDRVLAMLKGTDLERAREIAVLAPMNGVATVEKIAVNAVMAGCRPEHMPILIAAVEAIADPDFDLRGLATTTSPDVPLLIISGPVVKRLGLNAGSNVMGRGYHSNACIGRAVQLIINNVGGSRPGLTDMSVLGSPAEFGMVLVENPDITPWNGIWEDLGLSPEQSAVTLMGAEGERDMIANGWSAPDIIRLFGAHMRGLAFQRPRWGTVLLVLASDTSAQLAREGYTKERIRKELLRQNPIPRNEFAAWFSVDFNPDDLNKVLKNNQSEAIVFAPQVDNLLIVCSGGAGGMKNKLIPGWLFSPRPITRIIRLPDGK